MEGLFEKELKGQNGRIISIVTSQGEEKQVLAAIPRIDGQDITPVSYTHLFSKTRMQGVVFRVSRSFVRVPSSIPATVWV